MYVGPTGGSDSTGAVNVKCSSKQLFFKMYEKSNKKSCDAIDCNNSAIYTCNEIEVHRRDFAVTFSGILGGSFMEKTSAQLFLF